MHSNSCAVTHMTSSVPNFIEYEHVNIPRKEHDFPMKWKTSQTVPQRLHV